MNYSNFTFIKICSDLGHLVTELTLRFLFSGLLYCINWANINHAFVCEHLDKEDLYRSSQDSLFTILSVTERQNVYLGQKFHDLYQQMQERILPEQELDELNDSNSFLSMAINSAVKDLEQSEVHNFCDSRKSYCGNYRIFLSLRFYVKSN